MSYNIEVAEIPVIGDASAYADAQAFMQAVSLVGPLRAVVHSIMLLLLLALVALL